MADLQKPDGVGSFLVTPYCSIYLIVRLSQPFQSRLPPVQERHILFPSPLNTQWTNYPERNPAGQYAASGEVSQNGERLGNKRLPTPCRSTAAPW